MSYSRATIHSVSSLDQLKALWPGNNTNAITVWLQGTSEFNRNAGMFTWDASSSEDGNDTTVINPTGNSGNGRWLSNSSASNINVFTPQQFGAYADGTEHAITADDIAANPQWVKKADGTDWQVGDSWDSVAIQQCIYACWAVTSPAGGDPVWNISVGGGLLLNGEMFVPVGSYYLNTQVVMIARGFTFSFEARSATNWNWYGDPDVTMFKTNAITRGDIHNLTLIAQVPTNVVLMSVDWDGTEPDSLKPQQLTFYDPWIEGGFMAYAGIDIAPSGSGSQGDTILFINSFASGCVHHAYGLFGTNAICNVWTGGDMQFNSRYGIYCVSGQVSVAHMHAENQYYYLNFTPAFSQITVGGSDVYATGPTGNPSSVIDFRSEAEITLVGDGTGNLGYNIQSLDASIVPWFEDYPYIWGQPVSGNTVNSTLNYKTYAMVDGGTSGAAYQWRKPTAVVGNLVTVAAASWGINQWQGYCCFYRYSNGFADHFEILSNTADTLTLDGVPGGFTAGVTMIHFSGYTDPVAANAPNFDTCPQGYSTVPGAVGGGFTIAEGSPNITVSVTNYALINVNDYIYLPGLDTVGPGVAGYVDFPTAWIAKVTGKTGPTTITVNRNAPISQTDAQGYWGGSLTDNMVEWMEIDFDCVRNVSLLTASGSRAGRLRNVLQVEGTYFTFRRSDYNRFANSWTPELRGSTSGQATVSSAIGWFEYLGSETVVAHGIIVTTNTASLVGSAQITLPATVSASTAASGVFAYITGANLSVGYTSLALSAVASSARATLIESGDNVASQALPGASLANASTLQFTIVFRREI